MTIKNIWRLTLREMTSNWLRFCMILAIIFLGVGIFIGILNTGSSLQLSVERYLNNVNAQDLVVYATYGLNDEDLATLKKAEGINAYPIQTVEAQIADAFIKVIPTTESINQPQIVEGSLPIQANEIALDRVLIDLYPDLKLGETMTLNTDQSTALLGLPTLQNTSFKIVGIVESPLYLLGRQRGYTNDGAHSLSGFAVVNPSAITGTRYSEIAVTLNDYATDPSVTILKAELESLLESRPAAALQELKKTLTPYQQSANLFRAILPNWHNEMNLDIDQLEEPTYMVNERSSLMGYQAIDSFIKQIRRIAFLFGALFFAVALLVTYTVLSQLLNDRRNTMGTLSALGYLKREIKFIYVIYAFIVSVLGCLLGYACGTWFIPRMILGVLPYFVVKERVVYWNHRDLLVTLGVVLLATIGTTLVLIYRQMKDKTANLMLAKMPKQGNHIWIEHFPIIWNKISFKWKISIRNLYRYLPRNLMTIMGMMGCTVLIVVGFGMLNTIKATGQRQYTYIQTFDGSVPIDAQTASALTNTSAIQTFVPINQQLFQVNITEQNTQFVTLNVLDSATNYQAYYHLENVESGETLAIKEGDVAINIRLAEILGLSVGDHLLLRRGKQTLELPITAIFTSYINHDVFMNEVTYQKLTDDVATPTHYLFMLAQRSDKALIEENPAFRQVIFTSDNLEAINNNAQSMSSLTVILIVFAFVLSSVVLYSLMAINIDERYRELATLKVLGMKTKQVSAYVYRESFVLSMTGALIGLFLGYYFTQIVLKTIEEDMVYYQTVIHPESYVMAFLFTIVFSSVIMLYFHFKLKNIQMVEALKGIN